MDRSRTLRLGDRSRDGRCDSSSPPSGEGSGRHFIRQGIGSYRRHQKTGRTLRIRVAVIALSVNIAVFWTLPSVASAQPDRTDRTTPTTAPAQPASGFVKFETMTDGGLITPLAVDCQGCIAAWGLWDLGFNIRALRQSRTNEVVDFIHAHGSILKAFNDTCAGDWRFGNAVENFVKEKFNTNQWQTHDKQYSQGSQHSWGNVGAHQWNEDGVLWAYGQNGESDLCSTF